MLQMANSIILIAFVSTLSKVKSTGTMDLFILSLGNEEAGNKGAVYSGFHPKCKYSREKAARRPEIALGRRINSRPSSTLLLVLLMLTNRCPKCNKPGAPSRLLQGSYDIEVWDSPPRAHKLHLCAFYLRWAVGYTLPLKAPGANAWGGVRESSDESMTDNLWIVGVWSLGNKYVSNVLENVSELVPGY